MNFLCVASNDNIFKTSNLNNAANIARFKRHIFKTHHINISYVIYLIIFVHQYLLYEYSKP